MDSSKAHHFSVGCGDALLGCRDARVVIAAAVPSMGVGDA
jgi:hypothetical protein